MTKRSLRLNHCLDRPRSKPLQAIVHKQKGRLFRRQQLIRDGLQGLPGAAKFFAGAIIDQTMEGIPETVRYRVTALEVESLPRDERLIPWIWDATANVASDVKTSDGGVGTVSFTWRIRFHFPMNGKKALSAGERSPTLVTRKQGVAPPKGLNGQRTFSQQFRLSG
jgi:hypothetical protein